MSQRIAVSTPRPEVIFVIASAALPAPASTSVAASLRAGIDRDFCYRNSTFRFCADLIVHHLVQCGNNMAKNLAGLPGNWLVLPSEDLAEEL